MIEVGKIVTWKAGLEDNILDLVGAVVAQRHYTDRYNHWDIEIQSPENMSGIMTYGVPEKVLSEK